QRGSEQVEIISEDLWEELFARNSNALGRAVRLDDIDRTVIGVLPRGADFGTPQIWGRATSGRGFPGRGGRPKVDVWLPFRPNPSFRRENHGLFVVGRLQDSLNTALAPEEFTALAADLRCGASAL